MLDMGFVIDVKKIIRDLPDERQSLFFSATLSPDIVKLAHTILREPVKVTITPEKPTVDAIKQLVYFVDKERKRDLLLHVLEDHDIKNALVFTRTKHGADIVVRNLTQHNIQAEAIHGNKSQNVRQRALNNFKLQKTRVLVATDIAARGIDVDDLAFVINYEIPEVAETYVHRIGRTGRAGQSGTALSFCDGGELPDLNSIERLIHKEIPAFTDHPFPMSAGHHNGSSVKKAPKNAHGAFHSPKEKAPVDHGANRRRSKKRRRR
jgi:ATP-dependent RNA helicase RhlE